MWAYNITVDGVFSDPVWDQRVKRPYTGSKPKGLTLSLRVGPSVSERVSWVICLYLTQSLGPKKKV